MTAPKTAGEFVDLVRAMRTAQIEYYKTKAPAHLIEAKKWECAVDAAIEERDQRKEGALPIRGGNNV